MGEKTIDQSTSNDGRDRERMDILLYALQREDGLVNNRLLVQGRKY